MSGAGGVDGAAPTEGTWTDALGRASALALLVVLPAHVLATVVLDDPGARTAADALARWESPGWRALDWLLVCLGAAHAAVGLTRAVATSRLRPGVRSVVVALVVAGAVALAGAMTLAVATVGR